MHSTPYRGRFAPSPTGALHFGSLIAAVGSFLQAKKAGGEWLVRIEDLDPLREITGASDLILRTLDAYGLYWDGPVVYQSNRLELYQVVLNRLLQDESAYACDCSRSKAAAAAIAAGLPPFVYPATCRSGTSGRRGRVAYRILTGGGSIAFVDAIQGPFNQDLEREVGDFVIRRVDGLFAYQLAVVIDDEEQGITEVIRGSDLLDSTPRQIHLQRLLGFDTPRYGHLPVAVNSAGQKLSKQTFAPAIDVNKAAPTLWQALAFLGQHPDPALRNADLEDLWAWAIANWQLARVPKQPTSPLDPALDGAHPPVK